MQNQVLMPAAGIAILVVTWKWWFRQLMVPKTMIRWLLATCYMLPLGVLFFIGIGLDLGKMPSVGGLAFIAAFLLVLWCLTGLPMAIFSPLKAIESHRVRQAYARDHGLVFQEKRISRNLLPKEAGLFSRYLTSVLQVAENAYIATSLRYISDLDMDTTLCRGYDYLVVEKLSFSDKVIAVHERARVVDDNGESKCMEFKGHFFRIIHLADSDPGRRTDEAAGLQDVSTDLLRSVLETVGGMPVVGLEALKRLYLANGRITLELDYLDRKSKLDSWVACAKRLARWLPPST